MSKSLDIFISNSQMETYICNYYYLYTLCSWILEINMSVLVVGSNIIPALFLLKDLSIFQYCQWNSMIVALMNMIIWIGL